MFHSLSIHHSAFNKYSHLSRSVEMVEETDAKSASRMGAHLQLKTTRLQYSIVGNVSAIFSLERWVLSKYVENLPSIYEATIAWSDSLMRFSWLQLWRDDTINTPRTHATMLLCMKDQKVDSGEGSACARV